MPCTERDEGSARRNEASADKTQKGRHLVKEDDTEQVRHQDLHGHPTSFLIGVPLFPEYLP